MPASRSPGDSAGNRPRIVVVDDCPDLREMLLWALEREGYEPVGVADGQEALASIARAAQDGRTPEVILLDLEMQGMDGWTFLQRFRLQWQGLSPVPRVVVATALEGAGIDAATLGVQAVVRKPYRVGQIIAVIGAFCPGGTGAGA